MKAGSVKCPLCDGTGCGEHAKGQMCMACNGTGRCEPTKGIVGLRLILMNFGGSVVRGEDNIEKAIAEIKKLMLEKIEEMYAGDEIVTRSLVVKAIADLFGGKE